MLKLNYKLLPMLMPLHKLNLLPLKMPTLLPKLKLLLNQLVILKQVPLLMPMQLQKLKHKLLSKRQQSHKLKLM